MEFESPPTNSLPPIPNFGIELAFQQLFTLWPIDRSSLSQDRFNPELILNGSAGTTGMKGSSEGRSRGKGSDFPLLVRLVLGLPSAFGM